SANVGLPPPPHHADLGEQNHLIIYLLKGYYGDKNEPATHFNAVAELKHLSMYDFDRLLDAIGTFAAQPEAEAQAAANKRIRNNHRKAEGDQPAQNDPTRLQD
ncbi:glycine--tRNA ligase subunit beta, partial [Stenotrophomonas maltophilia]